MKTYQERLQQYAQMHANKNRHMDSLGLYPQDSHEEFYREAEVTIASVAEGIRDALIEAVELGIFTTEGLSDPPETNYDKIEQYLIKNGYVPKEGNNNG